MNPSVSSRNGHFWKWGFMSSRLFWLEVVLSLVTHRKCCTFGSSLLYLAFPELVMTSKFKNQVFDYQIHDAAPLVILSPPRLTLVILLSFLEWFFCIFFEGGSLVFS